MRYNLGPSAFTEQKICFYLDLIECDNLCVTGVYPDAHLSPPLHGEFQYVWPEKVKVNEVVLLTGFLFCSVDAVCTQTRTWEAQGKHKSKSNIL